MSPRSDWEKHKNHFPSWEWATPCERLMVIGGWTFAGLVGAAIGAGILFALGSSVEGVTRYKSEHNRCLQNATNGYEILQCR